MRVISGKYRGKKLLFPEDNNVRPTKDFFKETLFNILQSKYRNYINGNILDLFAGSGALGIECASRGASNVVLIDSNNEAIKCIKNNINTLANRSIIQVIQADATKINLENINLKFNLIFLDPPYESNLVTDSLKNLLQQNIFSQDALFIIESNKYYKISNLRLLLQKDISSSKLQIYALQNNTNII